MEIQSIKTENEYLDLLEWVAKQFDLNTPPDSKEGQVLQHALSLIQQFEDSHYPIPSPQK